MSFNPSIPQVTDLLLQSQAQIRANYQAINQVWAENHYALTGNNELQGFHTVLTMRPQDMDPTTDATHVGFYNKLVDSIPELFFAPNNAQTPIQLTFSSVSTAIGQADQYSFVAGPFIIYMGIVVSPTQGQTVVLAPSSTLIYVGLNVTNSTIGTINPIAAEPTNITGSQFNINYFTIATGTFSVFYIAIGKP